MNRLHDHDFHPPQEKTAAAAYAGAQPNSSLAVVSLVFGILAWPVLPGLGAIIAVATGHAAYLQIRESGGRLGGRALAQAGLVLGYLQLAAIAAGLSFVFWYFRLGQWTAEGSPDAANVVIATPAPLPEVKLAEDMGREDFDLIDAHRMNVPGDEVIAFLKDPARSSQDPELALLTTRRLVTLNEGRVSAIDLRVITGVEDHTEGPVGGRGPNLAVFQGQDLRMRVPVAPGLRGDMFRVALSSARKVAREVAKGDSGTP